MALAAMPAMLLTGRVANRLDERAPAVLLPVFALAGVGLLLAALSPALAREPVVARAGG